MITPGKRSQPPEPEEFGIERMPEPTKPMLWYLRDRLANHVDKPLPSELCQELQFLVLWAEWRIDRLLTREQNSISARICRAQVHQAVCRPAR